MLAVVAFYQSQREMWSKRDPGIDQGKIWVRAKQHHLQATVLQSLEPRIEGPQLNLGKRRKLKGLHWRRYTRSS